MMVEASKFLKESNIDLEPKPIIRKDEKSPIDDINIEIWPLLKPKRHKSDSIGLISDTRLFPEMK